MKKTNDYIERDAAIITINKYRIGLRKQGLVILDGAVAEVKKRIDSLSAADVRPVVRGEWVFEQANHEQTDGYSCSVCGRGFRLLFFPEEYNFCPNCGADMRGDKDE